MGEYYFKWALKDNSNHPIIKLAQAHRAWKKADKTYNRKYDEQTRAQTVFGRKTNDQIAQEEKHQLWQAQKDLIQAFTNAIQQVQKEAQEVQEEATEDPVT